MFYNAVSFNQPLNQWNVAQVRDMSYMFYNATSFNQHFASWDVSLVSNMTAMFTYVTLSTENYDYTLWAWSQLDLQKDLTFDAGNSRYSQTSLMNRRYIIDTYNWTIIDGGPADEQNTPTTPSQPLNLVATVEKQNITLSWEQPENDGGSPIIEFRIYRSSGNGYIYIGFSTTTSFTDTSIKPKTTYSYVVRAVNEAGEGKQSEEVTVTTQEEQTTNSSPEEQTTTTSPEEQTNTQQTNSATELTSELSDNQSLPLQPTFIFVGLAFLMTRRINKRKFST
ncbi:MAG: BspA family leucine-rich repeat surface protein [Methanobacteriota archaeon]|nr:MAG: BspA family leucine-rich repeat surface protein [Euryarchaeota archaeon]